MKKKYNIILIFSILLFCITIIIWRLDWRYEIITSERILEYSNLSKKQVICLDKKLYLTSLIDTLMKKKNYTKEDIISFFEHKENSYLKEVDKNNPAFRPILRRSNKKNLEFDTIMQLKPNRIFFLFEDGKYTGILIGCNSDDLEKLSSYFDYFEK